jgi:hypothetical protein
MKKQTLALATVLIFLLAVVAVPWVQAQGNYGLEEANQAAGLPENANFPRTVGTILFIAISLIGAIFLILVIYGGFLWMTAGGNSQQTQKAGAIMRNGAIGVLIVLSAYAITRFVIIEILVGTDNSGNNGTYLPAEMQTTKVAVNPMIDKLI